MVNIPFPTKSCGVTQIAVLIYASKTVGGVPVPVPGASVKLTLGALPFQQQPVIQLAPTDAKGTTQTCISKLQYAEASIMKSNEDFGSGKGNWYRIGSFSGRTVPYTFLAEAKYTPSPINLPTTSPIPQPPTTACIGSISGTLPNFTSILASSTLQPNKILVPLKVTGNTSAPLSIYVDGSKLYSYRVETKSNGLEFDLIRALSAAGANMNTQHTVVIKSEATNCNITPFSFTSPPLIPTRTPPPIPTPSELCSQTITTVESINHPTEITNFDSTFYVYFRGIKEVCRTDPTNPAFINKLPKGTLGTITLGGLSSNFYLTNDGVLDIDLSKLINLQSLIGR